MVKFEGPVPGVPGAVIRIAAELPDHLPGAVPAGVYSQALENLLLIVVPGVARYLVSNGDTIEVAAAPGADEGAVATFLYGSARSALIHQRGELPLHAATLMPPHGEFAVALCGSSGAGKSTLAAELSRRAWILLADDTTPVTWNGAEPIAWPGHGHIKLWRDACERISIDTSQLKHARKGMEKFILPAPAHSNPVPLFGVVELVFGKAPRLGELSGIDKVNALSRNTFRPRQIRPLGRLADHMRIVTRIAGVVRAFQLAGARTATPGELADALEAQVL